MVNKFKLKKLFSDTDCTFLVQNFGLIRMNSEELVASIEAAFLDYILAALSELGDQVEDKGKIYVEAAFYINRARTLLEAMPHPAGKMSYRLSAMLDTLNKLIDGNDHFASSRAARFMEKNLTRKLRDIWCINTSTPFHPGTDDSGKNPRDYLLFCFRSAGKHYPEIEWFNDINEALADKLIKSVKK